jgi:hypothetical protein
MNPQYICTFYYIVAYLLKARTVEPEKQPLLGNSCATCNNGITAGSGVFCAVCTKAINQEGIQRHIEAAAMRKGKSTMSSQGILYEDVVL